MPVDLVLIILICRSFIKEEDKNLYLTFAFGLLVAHLNGNLIGTQSIIYLVTIFATHLIQRSRFAKNWILIIPLSLIFFSLNTATLSVLTNQSIQLFPKVVWETLLIVPAFHLLRIWEERFIPKKDIKLRV
ncbi:hypothetical protein A3D79_00565 [Candidatus Daviesbacteria bacterium RIFCSPHIGHO2_02_FULL_39_8]|nr:MAG: hypothetical protein A3D79_00565 [Candidatus Daviesbacteria bacterium RIFCSPHIGHO2_02_FULL_39_8]